MIRRYDPSTEYIGTGDYVASMEPDSAGDYVTYDDHRAALDAEKTRADGAATVLADLEQRFDAVKAERAAERAAHALEKRAHEHTWMRKAKHIDERDAAIARAEKAEAERDAVPCAECGAPATCFGVCDGVPGHACDECCGHGDEEGWCKPIADASPYLLSQRDAAIAARAESEAALSLLREQWDAMVRERDEARKLADFWHGEWDAKTSKIDALRVEVERLTKVRAAAEALLGSKMQTVGGSFCRIDAKAIDTLRAALAQPERVHYAEIEGAEHDE